MNEEIQINVRKLRPFTRFIYTIGELPTSYLISMTYEEQLIWFCNYLEKTVIPAINNNGLAVEELQGLFNELQDYVNNYFDNLDVQEEINNKLDEMALDGTLENLISQYIQLATTYVYDTVSDMKSATNLLNGCYARTSGFHAYNDDGGAFYKIRTIDVGDVVDEKKIIALTDDSLIAEIVIDKDKIYPEKFGAYGDNDHDDTEAIQYVIDNYDVVNFMNKTYYVKDGVYVGYGKKLIGNKTIFNGEDRSSNGIMLYANNNDAIVYVNIKDITLLKYNVGLYAINVNHSEFDNVICNQCSTGAIFAGTTWTCKFYNCAFKNNLHNGFECGLPITHPLLNLTINPGIATYDFYSCEFNNNLEWGFYGTMRVFTFTGGYSQGNVSGAFKIISTTSKPSGEITMLGVDIEEEDYGYYFETDNDRCEVNHVNIIGGQCTINLLESDETNALLYFKGTTCSSVYVHNINVKTRFNGGGTGENQPYHLYIDTANEKNIQAKINVGNVNLSNLKTNATSILADNIYRTTDNNLDLRIFDDTLYDGTNLTIPANSSIFINIPHLERLNSLKITTTTSASFEARIFGYGTTEFKSIGTTSGTSTDNVTILTANSNCNLIKLTNRLGTATVISKIEFTGYVSR